MSSKPPPADEGVRLESKTVSPKTALIFVVVILGICASLFFIIKPDGTHVASIEIIESIPRETTDAYTQGLEFIDGTLWEGTGGQIEGPYANGHRSLIRRYDPKTGKRIPGDDVTLEDRKIANPNWFGEGITELDGYVWQLTWKQGRALRYNKVDVFSRARQAKPARRFDYLGDGWGITTDRNKWDDVDDESTGKLIMSNGSANLMVIDPKTFAVVETIRVTDTKSEVAQLNELEFIEGDIYANIYTSDRIAVITWREDQVWKRGQVKRYIDCSKLREAAGVPDNADFALNGIAWRPELQAGAPEGERRILVTGKQWPAFYVIKVNETD